MAPTDAVPGLLIGIVDWNVENVQQGTNALSNSLL